MDTNRIPKQALQYRPKGRRNIGRPKKRCQDQFHFEDQGTGNTPNLSEHDDDDDDDDDTTTTTTMNYVSYIVYKYDND